MILLFVNLACFLCPIVLNYACSSIGLSLQSACSYHRFILAIFTEKNSKKQPVSVVRPVWYHEGTGAGVIVSLFQLAIDDRSGNFFVADYKNKKIQVLDGTVHYPYTYQHLRNLSEYV